MIEVEIDRSGSLGSARDQGGRPTCLAFAVSDLNAAANTCNHLSVEYLCHHAAQSSPNWVPGHGFTIEATLKAIANPGQPEESSYPYQSGTPNAPLSLPPVGIAPLFTSSTRLRNLSIDEVVQHALTGEAVGVVVAVTQSLYRPISGIVAFDQFVIPDAYHALVVVGIGASMMSGERHLLIRNSWGMGWGVNGHAWIPYKHAALHLVEGFLV